MDTDGATEILRDTHRVLCKHDYADLTLQDIDTEKATIHYYDRKTDLARAFLEFPYDEYTKRIGSGSDDCARGRISSLLDGLLGTGDASLGGKFWTAMLEIWTQALYGDEIWMQLVRFEEFLYEKLRTIIADGVDERVNPKLTAESLTATISGVHMSRWTGSTKAVGSTSKRNSSSTGHLR